MTFSADPALMSTAADPDVERVLAVLLPAVLARHGDLLAIKDLGSGRYVAANEAMLGFLQRDSAQVVGHVDADLFDPAFLGPLRAAEQTAVAHGEPLSSEHRFDHGGKRREYAVMRWATSVLNSDRRWMCSVWSDLGPQRQRETQLRTALEQIEQQQRTHELLQREIVDQALRDPVSGLYRGAHFEDQLRREVDLSTREHREFAIVFIEIDPLDAKVLALGAAGERRVLEAVGRLLRSGTRAMDASCRNGERRFAVLLSGVGLATAHARMEGLRRKCASLIVVHAGQELGFTVAMGVASFPHTAQTRDALVDACDAALTEARRRGGNHVTLAAIRFEAG